MILIIKRIIPLLILQIVFADSPKFGDTQITIMLKEYFHAAKNAPDLIGQRFYQNRGEMVIQLEIESTVGNVNESLLFGFNAISQIANVSKTTFTEAVLIMHFGDKALPAVAKSKIDCSKEFFVDNSFNENKWRKDCLTIAGG